MIGRNSISDRGITEKTKKEASKKGTAKSATREAESPRTGSSATRKTTTIPTSSKKKRRPSKGLGKRSLGLDFTPGPWDVICARGLRAWNHSGNRKLRAMIESKNDIYSQAQTKLQRTDVVTDIVETFRRKGAGFVRQEGNSTSNGNGGGDDNDDDENGGGEWFEVGDRLSREKVGQMLRESLGGKYRSSATAKKRRREIIAKWDGEYLTKSNSEVSQILSNVSTKMKQQSKGQPPLSDQDVLQLFNQTNTNLLDALKRDAALVQSFQEDMPKDESTLCSSSCHSFDADEDDMTHRFDNRRNSNISVGNLKSCSSFETEGSSSRTSIIILDDDDDDDEMTTSPMNHPQEYPV